MWAARRFSFGRRRRPGLATPQAWALALASSVAGLGGMLCYYGAFRGGEAAAAAVVPLTALYPALTAVVGIWVLRERLAPVQYVGVVLAVVAAVLIARGK